MMSNRNTAEFVSQSKIVHGDKYDYSQVIYKNNKTVVSIVCKIHGVFGQIAAVHLKGCGCPRCGGRMTNAEKFFENASLVHGDRYDYSDTKFKHSLQKLTIRCREHGLFSQTASCHTGGSGCPQCGKLQTRKSKSLATPDFLLRAQAIHGYLFDYSEVAYINATVPVKIICRRHGEFTQKPYSHLSGNGCPYCAGAIRTTDRYIEKARKIHSDRYDYTCVDYKNSLSKIEIVCLLHGPFTVNSADHLRGSGCPGCMVSHPEIVWLNALGVSRRQYRIRLSNGRLACVDGIDLATNTIYEHYGDFWHGNPEVYNPDDIHPIRKISYAKVYEKTLERENELRKLGYQIVSIWEKDLLKWIKDNPLS